MLPIATSMSFSHLRFAWRGGNPCQCSSSLSSTGRSSSNSPSAGKSRIVAQLQELFGRLDEVAYRQLIVLVEGHLPHQLADLKLCPF